jgi:hypothetical protein
MKNAFLPIVLALAAGCASRRVDADRAASDAALHSWSNVQKLPVGTAVRVTERDLDRAYGRILSVSDLNLTLELEAGSQSIPRSEIILIERFPASVPTSLPGAAVGVGAAFAVATSATPETYRPSVAPAHDTLDKAATPLRDGVYVDAVALVGETAERVGGAVERTRKTVIVYRARE